MAAFDFVEQAETVEVVHLQIGHYDIGLYARERSKCLTATRCRPDLESRPSQTDREQLQQIGVVIDQKDAGAVHWERLSL
jgi:hypothetical protein